MEKGRKEEGDKDGAKDKAVGDKKEGADEGDKKVGMTKASKPRKKVILQIVPVTLHGEHRENGGWRTQAGG